MNNALTTSRTLHYSAKTIFSKYSDPISLARWWGPAGNTNTFHSFDFREGGKWIFTMHSDGHDYHNEWMFQKIETNHILMKHDVAPIFTLEVLIEEINKNETKMTWIARFEDINFFENAQEFLREKNEENFDRLEEEIKHYTSHE
ncbi:MAG: SRPBCC family protein [Candidatus Altimarinota bacterium]